MLAMKCRANHRYIEYSTNELSRDRAYEICFFSSATSLSTTDCYPSVYGTYTRQCVMPTYLPEYTHKLPFST